MSAEPLKHGVVAVIQNSESHYLFIRRGWALKRAPGIWCFVGGEVEPGEAFEAALVREVQEEVGLSVEATGKIHETISPNGEFRLHWFRARRLDPQQAIQPHEHEVAEVRWLTLDDALLLDPMLPTLKAWLAQQAGG
jgi:8-oxo-dGTP diphosphatase